MKSLILGAFMLSLFFAVAQSMRVGAYKSNYSGSTNKNISAEQADSAVSRYASEVSNGMHYSQQQEASGLVMKTP